MKIQDYRIGIAGYGTMGQAIAEALLTQKCALTAFDLDAGKMRSQPSIGISDNIEHLLSGSQIVIIAVKPQDFKALLAGMSGSPALNKVLLVSIAAGIRTDDIEDNLLPVRVKMARAMPNLFIKQCCGTSAVCKGKNIKDIELEMVEDIFKCMGSVMIVNEDKMDAVTAVSGSGPGYLAYLLEVDNVPPKAFREYIGKIMPLYIDAAMAGGLSPEEARFFAGSTAQSLLKYFSDTNESLSDFYRRVSSRGGTTEAAIDVLRKKGTLREAVQAAVRRSSELTSLMRVK